MKYIVFVILLFSSIFCFSQDKIYYANGVKEDVRIIKETGDYVIVEENGDYLQVPKQEIAIIHYKDGTHKVCNQEYAERLKTRKYKSGDNISNSNASNDEFKKSRIEVNLASFAFGYAQISYEYFLAPSISLKIPLAYGFQTGSSVYSVRREYSAGVYFLAQLTQPSSKMGFYMGPGFDFGSAHMNKSFSDFWSGGIFNPNREAVTPTNGIGFYKNYYTIMLVIGNSMPVAKNLELGAELTPGFRQYLGSNGFISLQTGINLNVKFKF